MATLTLSNEQLRLVQTAMDLYSRIGILQFEEMLDHPTVYQMIVDQFSETRPIEVGDRTLRGEVVEIGNGYVKTKGSWGNGEEIRTWTDVEKIHHAPDWSRVHEVRDEFRLACASLKRIVSGRDYGTNSGPGIHHQQVDESCRLAFDLVQVIRHEFWKANPDRSSITVDSHIHFSSAKSAANVKVEIDKALDSTQV